MKANNHSVHFAVLVGLRAAVGAGCLAWTSLAAAIPEHASAPGADDATRSIHVTWVGAEAPAVFAKCLGSWFLREPNVSVSQEARLAVAPGGGSDSPNSMRVWVDARQLPHVRVYFTYSPVGQASRYLVHDVQLDEGLTELGTERLAQVIYSSLIALQQGRAQSPWSDVTSRLDPAPQNLPLPAAQNHLPSSPVAPATPASVPAEPAATRCPRPTSHWHLAASTGYGANLRGDEQLAHGPMLWSMLARAHRTGRIGFFVSARYLLPVESESRGVVVRLNGLQLRAGPTLEVELASHTWASLGVGIGADEIQVQPRTTNSSNRALEGGWNERLVASGLMALHVPTAIGTVFILGLLDVPLQRSHYDLATLAGGQQQLLTSSWLQPGLALLVRFDSTVQ